MNIGVNMSRYLSIVTLIASYFVLAGCNKNEQQLSPKAVLSQTMDGKIKIEYYNNTGCELRFMVISEGWKYIDRQDLSENAKWLRDSGAVLVNGYFSAAEKGRKESIGSETISNPLRGLIGKYDRIKLKVILEWDPEYPWLWLSPKSSVTYFDITNMVEQATAVDR